MNINRLAAGAYGIVVLVTVVLVGVAGEWREDAGLRIISLLALLVAETMGWRLIVNTNAAGGAGKSVPARLLFVTFTALYGAAVAIHIVVFWLVLSVSTIAYFIIHLVTLAVWAAGIGIAYVFSKYVDDQAKRTAEQTRLIDRMQSALQSIRQTLDRLDRAGHETLRSELRDLLERVKYSEPGSRDSTTLVEDSLLWQIDALEQCVRKLEQNAEDTGNIELSRQLIADIAKDLTRRTSPATRA